MGTDARCWLPWDVRLDDVCDVLAVLCGNPVRRIELGTKDGGWAVAMHPFYKVHTSDVTPCGVTVIPECHGIPRVGVIYYGFETSDGTPTVEGLPPLGRYLSDRARPANLAVFVELVKFFGGIVDYNDCDETDVDVWQPPSSPNNPEYDEVAWQALQQRIADLAPLTVAQIAAYREHAAYDDYEMTA